MARKKNKEEDSGDQLDPSAWMITFSDLLTLMLTFFVLLISMSSLDAKKLEKSFSFFLGAFGVLERGSAGPMGKQEAVQPFMILPRVFRDVEENLGAAMAQDVAKWFRTGSTEEDFPYGLELTVDPRGVVIKVGTTQVFESGTASLRPSARQILEDLGEIIADNPDLELLVEGHTDSLPIASKRFPSNWELSTGRAIEVLRLLVEKGVDPAKIAASGLAYTRPSVPNDTPENRARNRRIEIIIFREYKEHI